MKAERRHELKENTLAGFLENLPYYARVHGNKVLTGLIVVLLVVAFFRWRNAQAVQKQSTISANLAIARARISELSNPQFSAMLLLSGSKDAVNMRQSLTSEANTAIDTVAGETDDKTIRAEALLAKADLYWALANLPDPIAAATQPTLKSTTTPAENLKKAQDFYTNVLNNYPNEAMATVAARFGLAAIAENNRDMPAAAEQYTTIEKSDTLKMYKDLARQRLNFLDSIKGEPFLGTLKPETTTQPSGTQSTTQPESTAPATPATTAPATPTTTPVDAPVAAPMTPPTSAPTPQPASAPAAQP